MTWEEFIVLFLILYICIWKIFFFIKDFIDRKKYKPKNDKARKCNEQGGRVEAIKTR